MVNIENMRKKDKNLEDALCHITDSVLGKYYVLQGGGALHFIYSSPRYSSDIDFVDKRLKVGAEKFVKELEGIGAEKYSINRIRVMSSGLGLRAKWGFKENEPLAKIEVESRDNNEPISSKGKFGPILVKTPKDIYIDKIFANVSRYVERKDSSIFPFKPNDLFDLDYLVSTLGTEIPSREEILKRAIAYNKDYIFNNNNLTEIINLIVDEENHDFFRSCISKHMMPDVFDLMNFDRKYFVRRAEQFENYKI